MTVFLMLLQSGEEYCEIGVRGHCIIVDIADDGNEGLGLCYQICIRALLRGTNLFLVLSDLQFSKQGCFFYSVLPALLSLSAHKRVLVE